MLSIFDNIIAIMIAGVVILLLFSLQQRSTDFNIENSSIYSSKKFSLNFADWLEADLNLVGTNIDHGDVMFETPTYEGNNTKLITFYRDSLSFSPDITLQIQTKYEVDSSSVISLPDTTIQLYLLTRKERIENGVGGWDPWYERGIGPEWMSHFRINMLDEDGQPVIDPAQTAFLNVAFTLAMPNYSSNAYIREFNWASTVNIRRY